MCEDMDINAINAFRNNEGERVLSFDEHEIKPGETGLFEITSGKYKYANLRFVPLSGH